MIKTEYRIFPNKTYMADEYLQFKRIDKKGREIWCYVPEVPYAKLFGIYLTQEECPTELLEFREADFKRSFYKLESYMLIPFTQEYPNIEEYFKYLRNKRENYLKEQEDKKNMKIIYL